MKLPHHLILFLNLPFFEGAAENAIRVLRSGLTLAIPLSHETVGGMDAATHVCVESVAREAMGLK